MDAKDWLDNRGSDLFYDGRRLSISSKRSKDTIIDFQPNTFIGQHHTLRRSDRSNLPFGLSNGETLEATDSETTVEGTKVLRVQERYKGIPVYDALVTVEVDKQDGHLTGQVSGHILNEIQTDIISVEPSLNETAIVQLITDHFNANNYTSLHTNVYVYKSPEENRARLAWKVSFSFKDNGIPSRPSCFIDANTGEILYCYNSLRKFKIKARGGNKKTGELLYGIDMPLLDVQKKNGKCRYKSDEVAVYDYRGKREESSDVTIAEFDCIEGISDTANGAYSPTTDAYFFSKMTVNMFKQWANVDACTLSPLELYVHEDGEYSAYFDGSVFRFSDGGAYTYPYTTAGIIAHEIAHCFSEYHANFNYSGQSGGIDEAYSDLVGEAVKFFIFGQNDWKSGSDVFKEEGDYVRYLCDQSNDGMSITHMDQYNVDDKKDVHFLSGIFNKVACEMSKSRGWNLKSIFQVFTHANRFYWHPSSGFVDAACGVMKATYDLGHNVSDIETTFASVGIETCSINGYIRQVVANAVMPDLKAGIGEAIVFKIKTSKISAPYYVEMKTSQGSGDVDLYLARDPLFSPDKIIYTSQNVGNYETITMKKADYFVPVYLLLKPRLFAFSGVTLSVTDG